jgi:hypothetical protein
VLAERRCSERGTLAPKTPSRRRCWLGLRSLGIEVVCAPTDLSAGQVVAEALPALPGSAAVVSSASEWVDRLGLE